MPFPAVDSGVGGRSAKWLRKAQPASGSTAGPFGLSRLVDAPNVAAAASDLKPFQNAIALLAGTCSLRHSAPGCKVRSIPPTKRPW
jgi:hypothetical protein